MRKMIRTAVIPALALSMCLALAACGGGDSAGSSGGSTAGASASATYWDGTYIGRSEDHDEDESGNGSGYGEVVLVIENNEIVSCEFTMYELEGTVKDETYGADLSQENRLKAQKAVQSAPRYASMLVESGSLDGIDAISGATISYSEFVEAVNDALSQAAH